MLSVSFGHLFQYQILDSTWIYPKWQVLNQKENDAGNMMLATLNPFQLEIIHLC